MRQVILNKDNLREEEIKLKKRKVRALIIDDNHMVTLCKYGDVYLLPGGQIEENELESEALLRELNEELEINFLKNEIHPLLRTITMARDYPMHKNEQLTNQCCQTDYYWIQSNKKLDMHKRCLTPSEVKNNFQIMSIPLDRVLELVENQEYSSKRNTYFFKELLEVLKEYAKIKNEKLDTDDKNGMIDLHIHTTASDGEKTSNEILKMAIQMGAQAIAITDHDTILGLDNLCYDKNIIQVIPGIEMSAYSEIGRLHILGYGFDRNNLSFREKLEQLHINSIKNLLMFVDILAKDYSIFFEEEDIQHLTKLSRNIGRPDLAKLMVQYEIVQSVQEAFDKYLIDANRKLKNTLQKPKFQECLKMIKDAGGIPVLAHPHSLLLDFPVLADKIREMKKYGLQGIEVYHSNTSKDLSEKLVYLAIQEKLYITGGSDYHGLNTKPNIELLTGKNHNIKIKRLNILNDISSKL